MNKVYPIANYNLDYSEYVKKNYAPENIGISKDWRALFSNGKKLSQYNEVLLENGLPNDRFNNNPDKQYYSLKDDKLINQPLPYPSFKKDYPEENYPLNGKGAGSYFIEAGKCKTNIMNKDVCLQKKYKWIGANNTIPKNLQKFYPKLKNPIPKHLKNEKEKKEYMKKDAKPKGSCFKPRYIYINNKPRGPVNGMKGLVPTIMSDVADLSPDKMFALFKGQTITGSGGLLPCREEFKNNNDIQNKIIITLIIGFLIYYFI